MDLSLAQAVAGAVAQDALGAVGSSALEGLLNMIRQRFRRDTDALSALDEAGTDAEPLIQALARHIERDPDFAEDLRDWLRDAEARSDSTPTNQLRHSTQNTISGTVQGNVIQGRDIRGRFSFRGLRGGGE
ncbi:hypothetical protein ABZY09_20655 [Streptomyces sp. NPDC002928]|uniref:hypothetical protein n=1 Tax=Streptomyces sp. NPDC002928 TaxID=3154440 RepID=UPI0033B62339